MVPNQNLKFTALSIYWEYSFEISYSNWHRQNVASKRTINTLSGPTSTLVLKGVLKCKKYIYSNLDIITLMINWKVKIFSHKPTKIAEPLCVEKKISAADKAHSKTYALCWPISTVWLNLNQTGNRHKRLSGLR